MGDYNQVIKQAKIEAVSNLLNEAFRLGSTCRDMYNSGSPEEYDEYADKFKVIKNNLRDLKYNTDIIHGDVFE